MVGQLFATDAGHAAIIILVAGAEELCVAGMLATEYVVSIITDAVRVAARAIRMAAEGIAVLPVLPLAALLVITISMARVVRVECAVAPCGPAYVVYLHLTPAVKDVFV